METKILKSNTVKEFLQLCSPLLESKEALNNLILGIANNLLSDENYYGGQALLLSVVNEDICKACAIQTPERFLIVFADDDYIAAGMDAIADYLKSQDYKLPGVIGPTEISDHFSKRWLLNSELNSKHLMDQMVYRLDSLVNIPISPGNLRLAEEKDIEMIGDWVVNFFEDVNMPLHAEDGLSFAKKKVKEQAFYVWENEQVVSMAAANRKTKNGITISYVFTPKEFRKSGYASSVVYELSRLMLQKFKFCTLFTDLSNPTSNHIYKRIGYREVTEFSQVQFTVDR